MLVPFNNESTFDYMRADNADYVLENVLTLKESAQLVGVAPHTIQRWIDRDYIYYRPTAAGMLIFKPNLLQYANSRKGKQ